MPVEFLGMGAPNDGTEARGRTTEVFDKKYAAKIARIHEDNNWDHVLFAYSSGSPDPILQAGWVAANTGHIKIRLAHRPNTSFPTVAARQFLTLDHLSEGRVTVHFISGGDQTDQQREGDYLAKDERYRRTHEYITIVRKAWTSEEPFDWDGEFYKFENFRSEIRPFNGTPPLISFAGSSPAAWTAGAALADIYTLFGEPIEDTREQQQQILQQAAAQNRTRPLRWQIAFRPIVAPTDELAWEKAHRVVEDIRRFRESGGIWSKHHPLRKPDSAGSQRLLAVAERGERHDRALWTPTAKATGGGGSSTALVGSYETVAAALLDYVDLGFEIFGLRGYNFVPDAQEFGQHVIPLVKQEVARRDAEAGKQARAEREAEARRALS